jgi:hypothetical protein
MYRIKKLKKKEAKAQQTMSSRAPENDEDISPMLYQTNY